ncbi:MAG TPA: hypothetical protein VE712_02445 [Actinomycetota bacterium]|jgi:hypothetical protein|nr:hypothetical protein [Actinomycetota bacterium]
MIVRVLGEGQFELDESSLEALNELDDRLVEVIERGDEADFAARLEELLVAVRSHGSKVPEDYLGPSDLVLPGPGSTVEEVRSLLSEEGLIPD